MVAFSSSNIAIVGVLVAPDEVEISKVINSGAHDAKRRFYKVC